MRVKLFVGLAVAFSLRSLGQTVYVNGTCGDDSWSGSSPVCTAPNGPKQTIQAAIPTSGAVHVLVAPGTYLEQISVVRVNFGGSVLIESEGGAAVTTIDAQRGNAVNTSTALGGGYVALHGFTIQNAGTGVTQSSQMISIELQDCIFQDCDGCINARGSIAATDTVFQNNGQVIHLTPGFSAQANLNRCILRNNSDQAISATVSTVARLTNSIVVGNGTGNEPSLDASAAGQLTLLDCTVAGNSGPAAFLTDYQSRTSTLVAYNTIIWGNNSGGEQIRVEYEHRPPQIDVRYSIVDGGYVGVGNLSSDPLFVDPIAGDFHLAASSPAIDSGSAFLVPLEVTTDLDGQPRITDNSSVPNAGGPFPNYLDRGAYESAGTPYCPSDLDDDHDVDIADLTILLSQFGTSGAGVPGDLNRDGVVDIGDLATLLSNFGAACP